MAYELHKDFQDGQLVRLSLGIPEVDHYLEFLKWRCQPNTWLNYAHDLKLFFNFTDKAVAELTPADVFEFIRRQKETPHPRRPAKVRTFPDGSPGLSNRTVKRRLCALSNLYAYLIARGEPQIERNPVPSGLAIRGRTARPPANQVPLLRTPAGLPQVISPEEIGRFVGSLRTWRDKAMVLLMTLGGLRKAEVVGLTLADIQVGKKQVVVRHGKGDRPRTCCVAPSFFQVLNRYLQEERPQTDSEALFVSLKGAHRGQPLTVHGLTTIVEYHRTKAGTPHIQCHRLRYTCLTALREAGMSLEALQSQAGHQDINSTRLYLHLSNDLVRAEYLEASKKMFVEEVGEPEASASVSAPMGGGS